MSVSLQLGTQTLISLGTSYGDIAALVQHGRLVANWLRADQNDKELFESISEVYGVVLRRRGLVDPMHMNNRWSAQWHFIHRGRVVSEEGSGCASKDGELAGFSWLMVAIVTATDLCMTSGDTKEILAEIFVRILDRDDVKDLSEALLIQLSANIQSWRSTGCIRGLVVPIQSTMRECHMKLVGSSSFGQITPTERRELSDLLVWLLAGHGDTHHVLSASCLAVFEGLKAAGIQLDVAEQGDVSRGRPMLYYLVSQHGEAGLEKILEESLSTQPLPFSLIIPPQQVTFIARDPAEMIECFRRPVHVKNKMSIAWKRGAAAAQKVRLEHSVASWAARDHESICYKVGGFDHTTSRWSFDILSLAHLAFPADSQQLCEAIDDTFGDDAHSLKDWLNSNILAGEINTGRDFEGHSLIMDLSQNFPASELDRFLVFQSLVHGYWYSLLDQYVTGKYLDGKTYLSTLWGWRDHRLLNALMSLNKAMRKSSGIHRGLLLQLLGLMFAGRTMTKVPNWRELVGIVGTISVISLPLLHPTDNPQMVAKCAIISLPILDLLPERNGSLYAISEFNGIKHLPVRPAKNVKLLPARRNWSIHARMRFKNDDLDGVMMVVRCDGKLIATFNPNDADVGVIKSFRPFLASSRMPSDEVVHGHELTEDMLYEGKACITYKLKEPLIVQSKGNLALRLFVTAMEAITGSAALLSGEYSLSLAEQELRATQPELKVLIC